MMRYVNHSRREQYQSSVVGGRSRKGFSLVEQLFSLLIIAIAAVLLIRTSTANAIVSQQSARRMSVVRLSSELSAWFQRGGHQALGVPIDDALHQLQNGTVTPGSSLRCCPPDGCDASASAWHYLTLWHSRLLHFAPDVQVMTCVGEPGISSQPYWYCSPQGRVLLMRFDWPTAKTVPSIVIPLVAVQ